jgi:PAS domain S-box-containing protein
MPKAVHATSARTATVFANGFHPTPPPDIIAEGSERAWAAREQPANDCKRRFHETQKELALANRVALPEQLSASIAEINQPISAVVMNAEAALWLLRAEPTDMQAVRRLLDCIVKDGMRTGDIVNRTRALSGEAEPVQPLGTNVDITRRHVAEEEQQKTFDELKRSQDHLQLVIDTIPTLVWRTAADGVPDFLNKQALDYTGLTPGVVELDWRRAFHPDDKKDVFVKWAAIRASGKRGSLEARLLRFDGRYRWFQFEAEPLRDTSGNIVEWYGSATDIEDRKLAELALRESEQRFRDYAETASDWLWETGPDHRITTVSENVNVAGFPRLRLDGVARWEVATDLETEPEKWRQHRQTLDAHWPFRDFVYGTINESGSQVYIRTNGRPVFDVEGGFLGYRGTATDITASIRADQAEQALRNAQAELAHVTRVTMLGELTASIAHEVNQPLAAVLANAEACLGWLRGGTPDVDAACRSVEWITDDVNRAGNVIRRVRTLAKKNTLEKVPLDVNDVVRETIALVRRELISHRVSLRMDLAAALPMSLGDRVQLQQVIINLVMNGIEAMQSVTDRPRELVVSSGQDESGQALISVADCGVGIAAENVHRLFDPFFTTKSDGMGMGLSICRSIMEAHGGRLWVTANLPHGAIFQFTLPVGTESES